MFKLRSKLLENMYFISYWLTIRSKIDRYSVYNSEYQSIKNN